MNILSFIISGLFYVEVFICIGTGIYLLYININSIINKLAFLFCTSLVCWLLGAANSLIASDYTESMVWRRFAAVGAGTFFSFLLHYIVLLTGKERLLKKRWIQYAIYIPSIIVLYLLAISENITKQLYHLEKTSIGWINISKFNWCIIFFDLYIISYMLIGLYMVYQWKSDSKDRNEKKQANIIFISYFISFFIAVIAEIFDNSNTYIHELAPLILIIPMGSICYAIKKLDFMKEAVVNEDILFMDQFRTKITKHLSTAYFAGGILYFVSEYIHNKRAAFSKVILFSFILFLFGISIFFIQKYGKNRKLKILLYSSILAISIPVINLQYIEYASVTVWAFPFIVIIATLLFNNATVLTMVSTSMILTQIFVWIKVPDCIVQLSKDDYLTRIGLMVLAICLIYYINKIYLLRLSQLSDKIKMQDLLFIISSRSINVNNNNIKEKMNEVLHLLCDNLQAERAHIYYSTSQEGIEDSNYSWCNELCLLDDRILQDISITHYCWWKKQVEENGVIQIPDVLKLPKEADKEKELLTNQNVKSMVAVPLVSNGQKIGFMRIDYVFDNKTWDDEFIKVLMIVGNIIGEVNVKASSEKKMEQMAYYDQLTHIPNRQLIGERINQAIACAGQSGDLIGIIFLDLDSFKIINDTVGHHYGDKILIIIADRLTNCLRKTDTVCRFGGDEFLLMLKNVFTQKDIEKVIKKIIKQFEKPVYIEDQEFYITASIGISIYPVDGSDKDSLIKNADIAMYRAKNNGKNQFVFCSQDMKDEIQQTMLITNNLYHALERNELFIVYQPQISIETGEIIALEALARWDHPELGFISPAIFIPIAEHTGLINIIGEWILKEACTQNKLWQDMGLPKVRMAVNVSVNQLLNSNFVSKVMEILEETGLEPRYLELEITENIAIQKSDFIIDVLSELKEIGVSLAIDDFGIEYSSLNRIKMLPIDRLKIDIHFINGILSNDKDRVIVDVIIKLAKDLKLKVIAEGVELEEQMNYLKQKKCDEVQGYYFYKPLLKDEMDEVLVNM